MKKEIIYELIKSHYKTDEIKFKELSMQIARFFIKNQAETAGYNLISFIDGEAKMQYQNYPSDSSFSFIKEVKETSISKERLYMPKIIQKDLTNIAKIIKNQNRDLQKFLFYGDPGTGKTETIKLLSKQLEIPLFSVSLTDIIDSRLGETSKNINKLIEEIWTLDKRMNPSILLIDEIDRIALDRINSADHREMGRATTSFFKLLEADFSNIYVIATTNLYKNMDLALSRRFDWSVSFNNYTEKDLEDIFINLILNKYNFKTPVTEKFISKIYKYNIYHTPAEIKKLIKIINATSENSYEFFNKLFFEVNNEQPTLNILDKKGMTVREISKIIPKSKSTIAKELK